MKQRGGAGLEVLMILSLMVLVFIVLPISLGMVWDNFQCKTQASVMQKPATWGPVQGCMIQVHGEWLPIERYRVLD